MLQTISEIFFLDFVENYYQKYSLKTLTKEKWKKEDNTEITTSHPPVETIIITHKNTQISASPFKLPGQEENNRKIVEQNNYKNQSLITMGKQLDKIKTKIDKLTGQDTKLKP